MIYLFILRSTIDYLNNIHGFIMVTIITDKCNCVKSWAEKCIGTSITIALLFSSTQCTTFGGFFKNHYWCRTLIDNFSNTKHVFS